METKPFSLQAPEAIAKEYGGNKQKIGQAAQMGLLDPTAAVLAGMFIDRMRTAAQAEAQPQQTVAQQVFAPPAPQMPQGGLGGIPQGAPAIPPAAPPMPAAQGMPGMAEGGLAGLEVPDDMFMETDDYAGGGMVAFAKAGPVGYENMSMADLILGAPEPEYMGLGTALGDISQYVGTPGGKYREQYLADLERRLSPEYAEEEKQAGLGEFLARLGFGMAAGKSQNALQNLAAAAAPAGEAAIAGTRERKKEQRAALKEGVDAELADFGVKAKNFDTAMAYRNTVNDLMEKGATREQAKRQAFANFQLDQERNEISRRSADAQMIQATRATAFDKTYNAFLRQNLAGGKMTREQAEADAAMRANQASSPYSGLKAAKTAADYKKTLLDTWENAQEYQTLKLLKGNLSKEKKATLAALEVERANLMKMADALYAAEAGGAGGATGVSLEGWGKPDLVQ